jgi:GAF domain-containing protein
VKPPPAPAVDLAHASRICAELARVVDAGGITAILARAAGVLDAHGLIVWVADAPGSALYPVFSHGYPSSVLMRLGSLPTDADNATAASWRTGEAVAIEAAADTRGALVTPIITAEGCVGVLAAELQNRGEAREEIRALATIFSAQLATVVTPVAAVGEVGLADRVAQ